MLEAKEPKERIIVALDVDSVDKALALVQVLSPHVGLFKIGLELMHALFLMLLTPVKPGDTDAVLFKIRKLFTLLDGKLFWDGKFHDIPSTVGGATRSLAEIGVRMFSIHASAGIEAMRAAVANKGDSLVLAATVLTSLSNEQSKTIYGTATSERVDEFATDARIAGCDGIICSPRELQSLGSDSLFDGLLKVTPGIRNEDDPPDDQQRTMTAEEAIVAGADYLVIGRPITTAPNLRQAAQRFAEEIRLGLAARR